MTTTQNSSITNSDTSSSSTSIFMHCYNFSRNIFLNNTPSRYLFSRKEFLSTPSKYIFSRQYIIQRESRTLSPFNSSFSLSSYSNTNIISLVSLVSISSYISNVSRLIISRVIYSIYFESILPSYRKTIWQKLSKIMKPLFCYWNSSSSVVEKVLIFSIVTSLFHIRPFSIQWMPPVSMFSNHTLKLKYKQKQYTEKWNKFKYINMNNATV